MRKIEIRDFSGELSDGVGDVSGELVPVEVEGVEVLELGERRRDRTG